MRKINKAFKSKKFKIICAVSVILIIGIIITCNQIINNSTNDLIFNKIENIPHNKVGLLLGTSKYLKSGQPNMYFFNRINAAVELYKAGKIDFIIASGDNNSVEDNEPLDMKNKLIQKGVPEEKIYLDYAGFRTYDSVVRMNKIFSQTSFTIISQEFHNRRAIYIANQLGLNTIGYNANDVSTYNGFKTQAREKLARVKVFIDFLMNKEPKFLGEKIEIQ